MFRDAASEQEKHVCTRLRDVVDIWQQEGYIPQELLAHLREVISDPSMNTDATPANEHQKTFTSNDLPFLMPLHHGDPSLPFYELPAGNFMPHIIPNRSISMRPESIRPLQFTAGPATEGLVDAVKGFLEDVALLDDAVEEEGNVADIDDLGQLCSRNEAGNMRGDTYYGWSRAFCEKMTARRNPQSNGSRTRGRSPSYSPSRSPSPGRKRSYSRSSSNRSRSHSRHMSSRFSGGRSRSRSPPGGPRFMQTMDVRPPASSYPFDPRQGQHLAQSPSFGTGAYTNNNRPPFSPPPLLPGTMPIPPPRPLNWPAGSPWPPHPPPPNAGNNLPYAPAAASTFAMASKNGPPRYHGR